MSICFVHLFSVTFATPVLHNIGVIFFELWVYLIFYGLRESVLIEIGFADKSGLIVFLIFVVVGIVDDG